MCILLRFIMMQDIHVLYRSFLTYVVSASVYTVHNNFICLCVRVVLVTSFTSCNLHQTFRQFSFLLVYYNRLRWSRGSVLAFGPQVRGFKPGRSRRIFKGEKILSTPSFGGEVKPSVPRRRFAACKRSLELRGSRILDEICRNISHPRRVPPRVVGREGT